MNTTIKVTYTAAEFMAIATRTEAQDFSCFTVSGSASDVTVLVVTGDAPADYRMDSFEDGSIMVTGDGDGTAIRSGSGNGHAIREGDGSGHAIHLGSGNGSACRTGNGHGHATFQRVA